MVVLGWWLPYTVVIVWEFAWADLALVVLDEWSFYRGGCLNRFDCICYRKVILFFFLVSVISFGPIIIQCISQNKLFHKTNVLKLPKNFQFLLFTMSSPYYINTIKCCIITIFSVFKYIFNSLTLGLFRKTSFDPFISNGLQNEIWH